MQELALRESSVEEAIAAKVGASYVQGGIKRTTLQKANFPEGYTVNCSIIEVPNGTSAAPHTHPGLECTYVLEGEFDLVTEGKPDKRFKPGMSYMVTDKDVHFARVLSETPIKLLCVFIHDKAKTVADVVGNAERR
ncbi:cupin domain-containing protein [Ramlibacter sp.]|uniref:cupin domain-containing protein n=1 Tax=Ramlibacter sp. TaxID=1917967 RepID=UPI0017B31C68|nr:cupin domain-containing protein [Ramlibacter sp.]MBA2674318.1 cupin domain-containing protein [Ramlibacter sp.]